MAFGMSQGVNQWLMQLMRDQAAERSSERTGDLQEKRDMRTLARQGEMMAGQQAFTARQTAMGELPELVEKLGPDGAQAMLAARGVDLFPPETPFDQTGTGEYQQEKAEGQAMTGALVGALRTPLRRKLESTVGKRIGDATTPEGLGDSDIMGQVLAADDRVTPPEDEPGMRIGGLRPEAYDYVARAQDKREALESKPTQQVTGENPDGSKFTQMKSPYDLAEPMVTGPSTAQAGTNTGQAKVNELQVSGPALTKQAGAEGYARANAAIKAQLDNSKALLDHELAKATQELSLIPTRVAQTRAADRLADAHETGAKLLPAATQLQTLWLEAVPSIQAMTAAMGGRAGLGASESFQPSSTLPPAVKRYSDFVDAVRPMLARAFGQTGNPALMEQEWAKYVPSYSEALTPNTALEKLARLEALGTSALAIAQAQQQKGMLTGADVDAIIQPRIDAALKVLQERAGQMPGAVPNSAPKLDPRTGVEWIVTPTGMQMVRPGGQ